MKGKKCIYYILIAILLAVFIFCAVYVGRYLLDAKTQADRYDGLAAMVAQARSEAAAAPESGGTEAASEAEEASMLPEYEAVYALNDHLVGWLKIEGTEIDYPVMQTPGEPNYYLHRNFDRQTNSHGCLYAAESCDINAPSDNITIYGHHMKDGSMFAGLSDYLRQSFWETHDTLTFDTLTEHHTYQIFAVFKTTASEGKGFAYHQFVDAEDPADFDAFIAGCKVLALYDTGITPAYGDKIICLSTCEYTQENGRLVVAAVRID